MTRATRRFSREKLLADIVWQEPLLDPVMPGYSGAQLRRVRLRDGTPLILKHLEPERDLAMVLSRDTGRAATLWLSGFFDSLPDCIDLAIVGAWQEGNGWVLAMRDVSRYLLAEHASLSRDENRRVLGWIAQYHEVYAGRSHQGLCNIETHLTMLAPEAVRATGSEAEIVRSILAGWEIFRRIVPGDLVSTVSDVHRRPQALAERLRSGGTTLAHGDLWFSNLGITDTGLVILDWALCVEAPGTLDLALYLLGNGHGIRASREEIVNDFRAAYRHPPSEQDMEVAFAAAVVEYGWLLALSLEEGYIEQEEMNWWLGAVKRVLMAVP